MANTNVGPNQNPVLYARNSAGGTATYVTATNNKLDVNATASLAGSSIPATGLSTAVAVQIVDGSGNQITSFGGGTQYTNGSAQATPTGTVALGYDGANVRALLTSNTGQLAVTANAGTNLNTSLLATSANLTAGSQKTQIVDGSGNVIASTSNALNVNISSSGLSNQSVNLAQVAGTTTDVNSGNTSAGSQRVVLAGGGTGTLSNVSGSASSVTLLAANSARRGATITNDSSALLYVKFGATASTSSYTVVITGASAAPFAYYEVPFGYSGIITGIWASATGNARVTEIT